MDDDDLEHLVGDIVLLPGSSQESLTDAAANMSFVGHVQDGDEADMGGGICPTHDGHDGRDDADMAANWPEVASEEQNTASSLQPNPHAIAKIEAVFELMADAMLNGRKQLSIALRVRKSKAKDPKAKDPKANDPKANDPHASFERYGPTRRICFPGKTEEEAWRFAVVLRILELMHEALRNDVVMSKRDIYYRDPALFGSQTYVDRYVDDIAFNFGLSRASLNVSAVAKGLVAGAFIIHRKDGSSTAANTDREGLLVPSLRDVQAVAMKSVKWILVIEKEATFRSITASGFWDAIAAQGIILTGKGYPDLSTRALLHLLSTASPQNGFASPPVYGLADLDPDGVSILSTYKHGSQSLAHENDNHCTPQLEWLGLRSEHLHLNLDNTHASQGLLHLTARDRKKAVNVLKQDDDQTISEDWKAELRTMLMLNTKAELQLLDATPNGMVDLLAANLPGGISDSVRCHGVDC